MDGPGSNRKMYRLEDDGGDDDGSCHGSTDNLKVTKLGRVPTGWFIVYTHLSSFVAQSAFEGSSLGEGDQGPAAHRGDDRDAGVVLNHEDEGEVGLQLTLYPDVEVDALLDTCEGP